MTERYKLSRRKALAGLGTIGVAGAGAGLGTSALFSDEEEFENNQLTAGTLDMAVTAEVVAANEYWKNQEILGNPVTADGDVLQKFQLHDVKPGDWAIICFTVDSVADNPFYLTIHGDADEYKEKEGKTTEPEKDADSTWVDDGWEWVNATNAELGDKLLVSYWEQWDGTAPSEGTQSGGKTELGRMDNITNTESNAYPSASSYSEPGEDGVVNSGLGYTDAREFYFGNDQNPNTSEPDNDPLGNGIASGDGILVGGTSDPVQVGSTDPNEISRPRMGDPDNDSEAELTFYLLLELPSEVGNEIQGDGVKGNLRFSAEQVRNNDDPRSGGS
ncbi:SipW-dependent-type signal peptide-containing protein [Natronomonas marina]|uniref:SipW-dependent-type signal peptide-containing protein n=1 Tax=Natronomonas marina TaxID=2961939 RepID=UPI0020C9E624|nr:SipW-dependent-type signal peptide-containing protein [Natronomonas marina]